MYIMIFLTLNMIAVTGNKRERITTFLSYPFILIDVGIPYSYFQCSW